NSPTFTPTWPPGACGNSCNWTTVNVDCWNQIAGCNVCAQTGASWVVGAPSCCTFTDPCPAGNIARGITVVVYGQNCSLTEPINSTVNGAGVGSALGTLTSCGSCGNCQAVTIG